MRNNYRFQLEKKIEVTVNIKARSLAEAKFMLNRMIENRKE